MTRCMRWGLLVAVVGSGLCSGCKSAPNTGTGAVAGTALGAGVGTIIGAATGNPKTGAIAGAAIGGGIGTAIGAEADAKDRERADQVRLAEAQAATAANTVRGPLSMDDVVQLSKPDPTNNTRMSDDLLIDYIRTTNSRFDLSPGDLQYLRTSGVSDRVIREMVNSRTRVAIHQQPRTVIVEQPAPTTIVYERPYHPYYYRPYYYGPPPGVGIGFSYRGR